MVDDVEAARVALGLGPWVFWGMSGGGWLGLIYARRHPDALAGLILESIDACFRVRLADPACVLSPQHPAWRESWRRPVCSTRASAPRTRGTPTTNGSTCRGRQRAARARRCGAARLADGAVAGDAAHHAGVARVDTRAWLASVDVPALVMCGDADPIVPLAHARALHEALPDSEFVEISGGGHVPTTERRPEVAAAVRRFLAELQ